MPQLTVTNHSELYPEVLNSLSKSASNEMSECLDDKIRKHAMKQTASQTSKFSVPWSIYLALGACGIQESDVKIKGTASCKFCRNNSQVSKYQSVGIALEDFYRTVEAHDKLLAP